jgi:hypothetical protein
VKPAAAATASTTESTVAFAQQSSKDGKDGKEFPSWMKGKTCHNCGQLDHISMVCPNDAKDESEDEDASANTKSKGESGGKKEKAAAAKKKKKAEKKVSFAQQAKDEQQQQDMNEWLLMNLYVAFTIPHVHVADTLCACITKTLLSHIRLPCPYFSDSCTPHIPVPPTFQFEAQLCTQISMCCHS